MYASTRRDKSKGVEMVTHTKRNSGGRKHPLHKGAVLCQTFHYICARCTWIHERWDVSSEVVGEWIQCTKLSSVKLRIRARKRQWQYKENFSNFSAAQTHKRHYAKQNVSKEVRKGKGNSRQKFKQQGAAIYLFEKYGIPLLFSYSFWL